MEERGGEAYPRGRQDLSPRLSIGLEGEGEGEGERGVKARAE